MQFRKFATIGALALLGSFGVACSGTDDPGTSGPGEDGPNPISVSGEAALSPADSCEDIRTQIVESTTERILKRRYRQQRRTAAAAEDSGAKESSNSSSSSGSESPSDYTKTNTQEDGVDETDIVKTDGDYIYTVQEDELLVLDSWPAKKTSIVARYSIAEHSSEKVGKKAVEHRNLDTDSLFLHDDRVAVFSNIYENYDYQGRRAESDERFRGTRITILDISKRANPELIKQLDVEGSMVSGRMIDGDVYLVSRSNVQTPVDVWDIATEENSDLPPRDYDLSEKERKERVQKARPIVRDMVRERLQETSITDLLPKRRLFDDAGDLVWSEKMYSCTDLYLPQQTARLGVLNVSHFNFDKPEKVTTTGLLANGWTVYASKKNLYVAMTSRFWGWGWGWNQRDDKSHIHKFSLDGANNRPRYAASGKVDGWLLDQFAMDEHNGHLRVASTESGRQFGVPEDEQEESKNHLTVLKERGHRLREVGSVRGLAKGERIYAVRMMGDKGYIVTFRQIDPLFTLDLSDPTNPKVEGELKITGFSNYIHPLGENHLMTIGQDANSEGVVQGVQLQIFDVGDMSNPKRIHQSTITTSRWSSWSEAMWNHHAFTYHPQRDVLAFPINIHQWDKNNGDDFSGLLVYRANAEDGFERLGKISHRDLRNDRNRWWTTVRRSVFIEDNVYSLSERGMKVNDLTNPSREHAAISF